MKITISLRSVAFGLVLSTAIIASTFSAHAAAPATYGKCNFPSSFLLRSLVRQEVLNDLAAKGFKTPLVTVTVLSKNVRTTVTKSNIVGLTSVTAKADGSYQLNTTGPISLPCTAEATVSIKGSYKDAAGVRKTFSGTQTVQVNAAFN